MIDDIIKRVHNLTQGQQKEVLEYLKSIQTSDKRAYPRKKTRIEADAVTGDKLIKSNILDISGSGAFINTKLKIDPDTGCRIVFCSPGHNRPFKLDGKIIRAEQTGIAIQFENVSPYFQQILDGAIWRKEE